MGTGDGRGSGLREQGARQAPPRTAAGGPPSVWTFPVSPAHPVHLNHICVPVLGLHSLGIQLQRKEERQREMGKAEEASLTGDGTGLCSSDAVACGLFFLAHPHSDFEKLCTAQHICDSTSEYFQGKFKELQRL